MVTKEAYMSTGKKKSKYVFGSGFSSFHHPVSKVIKSTEKFATFPQVFKHTHSFFPYDFGLGLGFGISATSSLLSVVFVTLLFTSGTKLIKPKAMFWVLALLSSFIVLSGDVIVLSEGASSRPHHINVGAIFSLSTLYGQVADIAMKAAEDDVNSDPTFLNGSKLRILMYDAKRNGFLSIMKG
ncbi:hypothetical protein YC2023_000338 [Brassica napus]